MNTKKLPLRKVVSTMLTNLAGKVEFGINLKGEVVQYPTDSIISDLYDVISLYADDTGFIKNEVISKPNNMCVLAKLTDGSYLTLYYTFKGNYWHNTINGTTFKISDSDVESWRYINDSR